MSQITKKRRTARATQVQLSKMIEYFYLNKGLAEGKFHAIHGKEEAQKKWTELANELNCMQGATKTAEQWQVVWRDLKSRTSIKAKDLRKEKALTGNKPITQPELTELEQHVIGIIGTEYVEGSKYCADSIPEEENLLEELECGNSSVLSEIPQVISICTNVSQEISQRSQYSNANSLDNDDEDLIFDNLLDENNLSEHNIRNVIEDSDTNQNVVNCESRKAPKTISSLKTNRKIPYLHPGSKPKQSNSSQNIHESISAKRRGSLSELHSSKENFQVIAQKQADAELIHAESAKIQAEASTMHAHAMTQIAHAIQKLTDTAATQAVNDSKRIQVFEKLTTTLENLLPTYLNNL